MMDWSRVCNEYHDRTTDEGAGALRHRARWEPADGCGSSSQDTKRWVIRRKAEVVAAVRGGLLSIEEACERYKLTVDEFLSWQRSIDKHGLPGLRATRIQEYRGD